MSIVRLTEGLIAVLFSVFIATTINPSVCSRGSHPAPFTQGSQKFIATTHLTQGSRKFVAIHTSQNKKPPASRRLNFYLYTIILLFAFNFRIISLEICLVNFLCGGTAGTKANQHKGQNCHSGYTVWKKGCHQSNAHKHNAEKSKA